MDLHNNLSLFEIIKNKPYKLFTTNDHININHYMALELEIKLNVTKHSRNWIKLGDVLYKWRLDPSLYIVSIPLEYKVTGEQLEWIKNNL
jgi:hypothetical protein